MCFEHFKNFNLHFLIICLDCSKEKQVSLKLGIFFNTEGDYICTYESNCNIICYQCNLSIFIDLKKKFKPQKKRDIYHGIKIVHKFPPPPPPKKKKKKILTLYFKKMIKIIACPCHQEQIEA